jgi:hypothetical protein
MSKKKQSTPPTLDELREHQEELKAEFGTNESIAFANVSMTQLSIARHYGGTKIDGKYFEYNPADDSLIRQDVAQWIAIKRHAKKKEPKPCDS